MAAQKFVKITFQEAYQYFKDHDIGQKRMNDQGESDSEIVESILYHHGVELINFSDENLEPEKLVSIACEYFRGLDLEKITQQKW